ncbi:MAG: signal transduction protein [Nitrospirae bacterium RBG_19FT_COMBO_42_15]|nr:MAG: signal transduction protein [Nitrospirae bacterium RBG_19FT_COMBO_42_15]
MVPVKKIMTKEVLMINEKTSIKEVASMMKTKKIGSILVEKNNEVIGIVTEADIVRRLVAEERDPNTTLVKTIMSSPLLTIDAEMSIIDANDMMDKNRVRHLAVKEEGKIVGLVSCRDVMHPIYMEGEEW